MTKIKSSFFVLPLLASILIGGTLAPAFAGSNTFICDGFVEDQTIDANVLVPRGGSCEFGFDTIINGTVTVQKDAELTISSQTEINGNLEAKGAGDIDITELHVNHISIVNSGDVVINQATTIWGNVELRGNDSVYLFEQSIFGNVSIVRNGDVEADDVGIGGNLEVSRNGSVILGSESFGVFVGGNSTCLKNDQIEGYSFAIGNNDGCPTP